jgi:hypothetical protein
MPKASSPRRPSGSGPQKQVASAGQRNEGEGNKTAARRYNRAVEETVRAGAFEKKAREAARALSGPEGSELRRAESLAKRGKTAPARPTAHK